MKKNSCAYLRRGRAGHERGHSKRDTDGDFSALRNSGNPSGGTPDFWKKISDS